MPQFFCFLFGQVLPKCGIICYNKRDFDNKEGCLGVVARVSAVCAELNINIEDITQSILQDMFCMIMLVDISACASEPAEIRARFDALGQEMGMQVTVTRQEVFDAMHKV